MTTDTQGFKTVAVFNEKFQADLLVAKLGDNGIPAGVFGADSSFTGLGLAESDYEAAMSILAAADKAE